MTTNVKRVFSIYLPSADWQTLSTALAQAKARSFSEYLTKWLRSEASRLERERGSLAERERMAVLSFIHNGCRSVEDIRYSCQTLTPIEIEAMLFSFEGEGLVSKEDGKRGRTWLWTVTPQGEAKLREKGLFT